jgi:hypothetical protein
MPTPIDEISRPPWPYDLTGKRPVPDLSALPPAEAERARARLTELEHACGCALGSTVAFTALAAYIALLALGTGWLADSVWISLAVGAGVFVLAAGVGKTLGLMRARRQRDGLIDELHWRIATAEQR